MTVEEIAAKKAEELKIVKPVTEDKPVEQAKEEKVEDKPKEKLPEAVEKRKDKIQSEIDRLISEKKAIEAEVGDLKGVVENIQKLKAEIESIKVEKVAPKEDVKDPDEQADEALMQIAMKQLEEDKALPREKRRELTKEELDDWFIEDATSAIEWMHKRNYRREHTREKILGQINNERNLSDLRKKQEPYVNQLLSEFPELKTDEKIVALKNAGKTETEIEDILNKEVKNYSLFMEVLKSDPKKFLQSINGPALVAEEMKKRLATQKPKQEVIDEERIREEAAEAERQRQARIDVGLSQGAGKDVEELQGKLSDFEQKVLLMAKRRGITKEQYEAAKKRREKNGFDSPSNLNAHGAK